MSADIQIKTENITRIYHKWSEEIRAVDGVTVEIERGGFAAVWGTSGAGKSTLLGLMGGLGRPNEGAVTVDGRDLNEMGEVELAKFRRNNIGFVFQAFNLIPTLTALENVAVPLVPAKENGSAREKKAKRALERVGLDKRAGHLPGEMSGGEQQRVGIARAIVNSPQIILADEPTSDLDRKSAESIFDLLTDLNKQGCTVVVATHDLRILDRVPRKLQMEDGRIVGKE